METPILMNQKLATILFLSAICILQFSCTKKMPIGKSSTLQFEEKKGIVAVEAEHFHSQELGEIRKWHLTAAANIPGSDSDGDEPHHASASGGAYLEILPDTRRNHEEKLIVGENFSNQAGKIGILNYKVFFNNTGRYYVWVRAYSTGTEDNGIHVGLNGDWLSSGQRMQWCEGKNQWAWASKQRTEEVHCGVEKLIYLDIPTKGLHTISFSMREDGFEFDKFILTKVYEAPIGKGIAEKYYKK